MKASARLAIAVAAAAALAGCGTSSPPPTPPPDRVQAIPGSSFKRVILTPLGAQRIGVQTTPVRRVHVGPRRSADVIPNSAVVYDIHGRAYTFIQPARLQYVRRPIIVARIAGDRVYLSSGPAAGTRVVSVGGEELLGAELGVTSGE